MKKEVFTILVILAFSIFVSARIQVNDLEFKDSYVTGEKISGKVNLTIEDEDFDIEITANSQSISLEEFLKLNGVTYSCDPYDCSNDYLASAGQTSKTFQIENNKKTYAGFYLTGQNLEIVDINFSLSSSFGPQVSTPLKIKFVEKLDWQFREFSTTSYSNNPRKGCFIEENKSEGPLIIGSTYCEEIYLRETNSIMAGVNLVNNNADNKQLEMVLYSEGSTAERGVCTLNPQTSNECIISAGINDYFVTGEYYICVRPKEGQTNYSIYESLNEKGCGFIYPRGSEEYTTRDYSLYAKEANYDDAGKLLSAELNLDKITELADELIKKRYDRDCTAGCVIPLEIEGITQNLRIENVEIYYRTLGDHLSREIFELKSIPAKVSFKGLLDLSLTNFTINESGRYRLFFGSSRIINQEIELIPAPIVTSVYPTNPPAGIPITFTAITDFEGSTEKLEYTWKFGNATERKTNTNSITYTLDQIRNYTLLVEVSAGGNLTSKREFIINAQNPKDAVNLTIKLKKKSLEDIIREINALPAWYQKGIKDYLNISRYQDEITQMENMFKRIHQEAGFVELAKAAYALDVPSSIQVIESKDFPLLTQIHEIKPEVIATYSGNVNEELDKYPNAILRWQTENIDSLIQSKKIGFTSYSGETKPIMMTYEIWIRSKADKESYFVVNSPLLSLYLAQDSTGFKNIEGTSLVTINPNEEKTYQFYILSDKETSFFISPRLSTLQIEAPIPEPCNFNFICEPELDENPSNCRHDCKPAGRMVFFLIIIIIIGLLIYSGLQVWYKYHYEKYLFQDKRQMFNLIMFVTNSKNRNMSDSEIYKILIKKGWSAEKVRYVIRKANGKNVGLPEIIPFERIAAFFRSKKSKKEIATRPEQQTRANFNKQGFQQGLR